MKDFDQQHSQDNQVTTAEQRQVRTEKHVASLRIHPGHKVYEFDLSTGVIAEATYESIYATFGGGIKKKVIQREQCLYAPALNGQNAIRKFAKMYERLAKAGHIVRPDNNPHQEVDDYGWPINGVETGPCKMCGGMSTHQDGCQGYNSFKSNP